MTKQTKEWVFGLFVVVTFPFPFLIIVGVLWLIWAMIEAAVKQVK